MTDIIDFLSTVHPLALALICALTVVDGWLLWLILRGWRE